MTDLIAIFKRLYPQPNDKVLWWMHLAVSTLPLLWVMLMCVYCLDVLLRLGHWPHPMVEAGPQDMFSSFLEAATSILYLSEMCSLLVWLPFTTWRWKRYTKRQRLWQVGLYVVGSAVSVIFLWINPGQFFDWWMD